MKLQMLAKTILRNLWILLLPLPFGLQRLLASHPDWVEQVYVRRFFPLISAPLRTLSSIPPFSITEIVTILAPGLLLILLYFLFQAIRRKRWLAWLKKVAWPSIWILTVIAWLFILLHGLNYVREPVARSFSLPV
ncbi:MAG: hypothetical protein H6Q62_362, partial [Firmicutes bacterium]|nr:hypothetical protein [Bacillota bacterium]